MGHKTKLIKKTKLPNKKKKKIFLLCVPHLHARGPHFIQKKKRAREPKSFPQLARGPQFADPWRSA